MDTRGGDRLLHSLKAAGPQGAPALARRLGISAVAVRQGMERLAREGLVGHRDERAGVGRPRRVWHLTEASHARFPDNHAGLTLELIAAARGVFGTAGLDRLIARREADARAVYKARIGGARALAERIARLAALRAEEGYMAEWREDTDGFLLVENHCPVYAAARACQGLCRSELDLFRAVLGPAVTVERVDHLLAGARRCAYRIAPAAKTLPPRRPRGAGTAPRRPPRS
ncbi:MAG: transcriptional regulator [Alphaproteobacteria bacterium]|nr:transcriptional regulator [Alphaproteobacteria bacterium]